MRRLIVIFFLIQQFIACTKSDFVQISGRVENGDSLVSIWVTDSIYSFPLDENDFFTGEIPLKQNEYATLLYNSLNLYLAPGEDLEIYVNALNFSGSLYFRGSLGGINNYLKEQEVAVFFDKDDYLLGEHEFISKMQALIDEKIKLLEAKNFTPSFTQLEKERIRYSVAGYASLYPFYRQQTRGEKGYYPSYIFTDFLSSFSLNNEALLGTKDYRNFLLNYVYLQGSHGRSGGNYSDGVADYIVSTVTNPQIKDFLLTEIVYRYIWENNGLEGARHLLEVFRRECSDENKVAYIDEQLKLWSRLLPGQPAPDFSVVNMDGEKESLESYRGSYLYITVWATWCVPCKNELPYLDLLCKEYYGKNIRFLTISVDGVAQEKRWLDFVSKHRYAGTHALADDDGRFNENYMIISVPRFVLIDPDGKIVSADAPRPSGPIHQLFDSLDI